MTVVLAIVGLVLLAYTTVAIGWALLSVTTTLAELYGRDAAAAKAHQLEVRVAGYACIGWLILISENVAGHYWFTAVIGLGAAWVAYRQWRDDDDRKNRRRRRRAKAAAVVRQLGGRLSVVPVPA